MRIIVTLATLLIATSACSRGPHRRHADALLVWTRAQGGPGSPELASVTTLAVPAVRSEPLSSADGLALWAWFRGRRSDVQPVLRPAGLQLREADREEAARHVEEARAYSVGIDPKHLFDNDRRWHRRLVACVRLGVEGKGGPIPDLDCVEECRDDRAACESRVAAELGLPPRTADEIVLEAAAALPPMKARGGEPDHGRVELWLVAAPPWLLPAVFRFSASEAPSDAWLAALFRDRHDRYGAAIRFMSDDVLEAVVDRPPRTLEEALPLARERRLLLGDCDYDADGVAEVAADVRALVDRTRWGYWWD